jgi:hypothetical protein
MEQTVAFEGIPDGDYTVTIVKPGKYVPKAVEVTVDGASADMGTVNLWLYGDVNNDGLVDADDVMNINRYSAGLSSAFDSGSPLDKRDREMAANITNVIFGDFDIDADDVMQINRYSAGLNSAFDAMN